MTKSYPSMDGYEILGLISDAGGQADVFRARQTSLDGQPVAIKLYREALVGDRERRRFIREVGAMVALGGHNHVVHLHRADELAGRPYLIMELCERSLADQLRNEGPFRPDLVVTVAAAASDALAAAHARGILHRDLKPSNLLWTQFGSLVVADFGIATLPTTGVNHTITAFSGTPGYLAPEILNGDGPTVQSDLYALGVTLFQLLYGRLPTPGERVADPNIPAGLTRAITAALSISPEHRPRTAAEFAATVADTGPAPTRVDPDRPRPPHNVAVATRVEPEISPGVVAPSPAPGLLVTARWSMAVAVASAVLLAVNFVPSWMGWVIAGVGVALVSYWMMAVRDETVRWAARAGFAICSLALAASPIYLLPALGPLASLHSVVAVVALLVAFVTKQLWFRRVKA